MDVVGVVVVDVALCCRSRWYSEQTAGVTAGRGGYWSEAIVDGDASSSLSEAENAPRHGGHERVEEGRPMKRGRFALESDLETSGRPTSAASGCRAVELSSCRAVLVPAASTHHQPGAPYRGRPTSFAHGDVGIDGGSPSPTQHTTLAVTVCCPHS